MKDYSEHVTAYLENTFQERKPDCLGACEYRESCACLNAYRTKTVCFLDYDYADEFDAQEKQLLHFDFKDQSFHVCTYHNNLIMKNQGKESN